MSANKNDTPVILISISATNLHEETGVKCYKVELMHADFGIDENDIRYNLEGAVTYALWLLKVHKTAEIIIANEIKDPIKKTLPPSVEAQKEKMNVWGRRLRDMVNAAWADGVFLEITNEQDIVNKEVVPKDWTTYRSHFLVDVCHAKMVNKPTSVVTTSIFKMIAFNSKEKGIIDRQYLGQYFPGREQNTAVISEVALVPDHPLDHGNMKYDPSKVEVLDLHNPNGKVFAVKPKDSDMEGFQKAFDATVADTGGYITKAVEELFPSETTAVDNSPTATKVK